MKKIWGGIASALGILVLILDNETAITGAREGIDLCVRSVIPSLFPFLYLSGIITGMLSSEAKNTKHRGNSRRILLLTGYFGGYPVGAQSVAQAYRAQLIAPQEVKRLLVCCNNPGPAFLFGIAASAFSEKWIVWLLWGIHIISSLIVYKLIPSGPYVSHGCSFQSKPLPTSRFFEAIRNMAQICGWVVLFRVFICILEFRFLGWIPKVWQIAVCGLLELTNGCIALEEISSLGLRFCMCALFLSFGGFCTLIQTHSVTNGLHTKTYLFGKILEGCCSYFLAYVLQFCLFDGSQRFSTPMPLLCGAITFIGISAIFIRKRKNSSRNLSAIGV